MLDEYLVLLEEAKKRDHRKIGKEMQLFMFSDGKGTVNTDSNFYRAVEKMAECALKMTESPLFKADFLEMTAFYLGGKMEALAIQCTGTYPAGSQWRPAGQRDTKPDGKGYLCLLYTSRCV